MNYTRKSTVGFSIGSILLDLIGAHLSIFQMFLLAYNNGKTVEISTSCSFNILFNYFIEFNYLFIHIYSFYKITDSVTDPFPEIMF